VKKKEERARFGLKQGSWSLAETSRGWGVVAKNKQQEPPPLNHLEQKTVGKWERRTRQRTEKVE